MKWMLVTTCLLLLITGTLSYAQTTYYSRNAGTAPLNWEESDSWTLNSDGSGAAAGPPTRIDHVVILFGHTIVIDAVDDNGSAGVAPDDLNRANVGTFTSSNLLEFYQTGNIDIDAGGILDVSVRMMIEGETFIYGTFNTTSVVVNLGKLNITSGATFDSGEDLILSGGSRTIIDNTSTVDDDVYLDHTEALLCGTGVLNIGNSASAPAEIQLLNGASTSQICDGFQVTCTADCGGAVTLPFTGSAGFTFDLNQYNYAKTITIDNTKVTGNLTNFPVLISFTDAALATTGNGGGVESANGYDIVFATADDCGVLIQIDHQLETYDGATGAIVAWVKVPDVSSTVDTDIYMYYGNPAITQGFSVTTTFDYDYIAIWHMQEDPTATNVIDATSTGHDATPIGTLLSFTGGQIANAIEFDGVSGNYLQTPSNELKTENNFTISAWFKADATSPSHIVWQGIGTVNGWGTNSGGDQEMHLALGYCCAPFSTVGDRISLFLGDNNEENNTDILSVNLDPFTETTNWHYTVGTFADMNGTPSAELWLDNTSVGINSGVNNASTARNLWDTDLRMGRPGADERRFDGKIDEVRISKIVRSDTWIQTEYNNQSDPGTFFTVTAGANISQCGPLPIELLYFRGKIQNQKVLLEWATATEINNDFFTIERSVDGFTFHELRTLEGAGNTYLTMYYSAIDNNPYYGLSYYRLKQTDYDGQYSYSNIIVINPDRGLQALDFTLFPNPTRNNLSVQVSGDAVLEDPYIEIYNTQGQRIKTVTVSRRIYGFELNVEHLKTGLYLVRLINEDYRGVRKFVKQ